ncbi:MAG: zinc metalloprotease HtpX [Candidatus Omnitrophica bacterium]|nr:zinc metalloprotease HtpX [Candidatus Omnitrophota bacterium]
MGLLLTVMFAILYGMGVIAGTYMGITGFHFYPIFALGLMFVQYMLGPKLVEWGMRVRYIERRDNPGLFAMVEDMAQRAKIPVPRIGIARMAIPNAFAFGRSLRDGRVCVTEGILRLLNPEELRAVMGHELSHLKNRDMLTITLLSVIPIVMYRLAWHFLFFGRRRSSSGGASPALIGLAAFIFYFITNLLVLYASRIREYFADRGSIALGNDPSALASSLYKLVYGSARMPKGSLRESEGLKAFFVNDPSRAQREIRDLAELDLDRSGTLDAHELSALRHKEVALGFSDRALELLSTHPNMLKRIKRLAEQRR